MQTEEALERVDEKPAKTTVSKKTGCLVVVCVVIGLAVLFAVITDDPCMSATQKERIVEEVKAELAAGLYPAADPASLRVGELESISGSLAYLPFEVTHRAELLQGVAALSYERGLGAPWGDEPTKTEKRLFTGIFNEGCELIPGEGSTSSPAHSTRIAN